MAHDSSAQRAAVSWATLRAISVLTAVRNSCSHERGVVARHRQTAQHPQGRQLGDGYQVRWATTLERQLAIAAQRLATVLNQALPGR
jgi:hypothetical protein